MLKISELNKKIQSGATGAPIAPKRGTVKASQLGEIIRQKNELPAKKTLSDESKVIMNKADSVEKIMLENAKKAKFAKKYNIDDFVKRNEQNQNGKLALKFNRDYTPSQQQEIENSIEKIMLSKEDRLVQAEVEKRIETKTNAIKNKIKSGKALDSTEREFLSVYGSTILTDGNMNEEFDLLANDNPLVTNYGKQAYDFISEEKQGGKLTDEQKDLISTFAVLRDVRSETGGEILKNDNAGNIIKAIELYNGTVNDDKDLIPKSFERFELYTKTGLSNYLEGTTVASKVLIGGSDAKEIGAIKDSQYNIASSALSYYFEKNEQGFNSFVQGVVTNMAQNAIPMAASIVAAPLGAGAIASSAAFTPSVFGNAYKEGVQLGITSQIDLINYATANTVAEVGLGYLLGGDTIFGGGVLSKLSAENISKNISSIAGKAIVKGAFNVGGEFAEETMQGLLGPILKEAFLGTDEVTIFDDFWGSLSASAYEGLMGMVSAGFTGTFSSISEAVSESEIQRIGKFYNEIFIKNKIDSKDIAKFYEETTTDKELLKAAKSILEGDVTDYAIGNLLHNAAIVSNKGNKLLYETIGEKILSNENGLLNVINFFEANLENGRIYPDNVMELYSQVKNSFEDTETAAIGKFICYADMYAPRAELIGKLFRTVNADSEKPILQSNANGGIINDGGDSDVNGEATDTSIEEGKNFGGKRKVSQSNATIDRYVAGGKAEILSRASEDGRRQIKVNYKKSNVTFTEGKPENTSGYRAYIAFCNAGINAIYCEGEIIRNVDGKDIVRKDAFTAPDGTVYISSLCEFTDKEIYNHERVHVADFSDNPIYIEYYDTLNFVVDLFSDKYIELADNINREQFTKEIIKDPKTGKIIEKIGKYDINNPDTVPIFIREIAAYVNQYVLSDPEFAKQTFGEMFKDWGAVVDAVNKFNTDMGADFSESASFMPGNEENGQSGTPAPTGNVVPIEGYGERHRLSKAEQDYITEICNALGRKVVFEHISETAKKLGIDTSKGIPDGYYENGVIHLGFVTVDPIQFVFKHELTHFLEFGKAKYNDFANLIMDSENFKAWVKSKGYDSVSDYNADVIKQYSKFDNKFNEHKANLEMVANFCAENLFGNRNEIRNLLESLNPVQRNKIIQLILDFIEAIKKKLKKFDTLAAEIETFEKEYIKLLKEVNEDFSSKSGDTVNKNSELEIEKDTYDIKFSFARVYDTAQIKAAEKTEQEMKDDNKSEDEIRRAIWQEHKIIRDTGGIWVYEIDDSEMKFHLYGDAQKEHTGELKEFYDLVKSNRRTKEKRERYFELLEKYGSPYFQKGKLVDYVKHDELFEKYPQLKDVNIEFKRLGKADGEYNPETNTIFLNSILFMSNDELKGIDRKMDELNRKLYIDNVIIHEIQHALQYYDERENGSNIEVWSDRLLRGERLPINPQTGEELTPEDAYYYTHGEYEARQAGGRKTWDKEDREEEMPDLGWGKTISAKEAVTSSGVKFSIPSNSDYMSAVENGDTETAQELVDKAAKSAGYSERLYHQTGADFTEFNTENQKAGKFDYELPTGTFLKPTDKDIGLSGKKQMELYAKFQNPLHFADRKEAKAYWSENIPEYKQAVKELNKLNAEYRQRVDEAEADVQDYINEWRRNNPDASRREVYNDPQFQKLYDVQQDITEEWDKAEGEAGIKAKNIIDNFIKESGYDGIIIERDDDGKNRYTKSYIAFSSAQLKSADAVTYDDNGEVIPLSERFNVGNNDIRYSAPNAHSPEILLERYESGEITRAEYLNALRGEKTLNPVEIADLTEEDANTTPPIARRQGESDGDKESKFYGSLLESDIFDQRFKNEVTLDSFIEKYKSVTNKETLKKAAKELDEGGRAYVEKWWNITPDRASLIDTAVGFILMDRYQRIGNYESAVAIAEKVREFGTASGQQVQIFSIIGRLDPNAMAVYAQKTLDKAFKELSEIKNQEWIDKNIDAFKLTQEDIEFIRRHTLQAALFEDGTRPKAVALGKICARIQDKIPPNIGRSFVAFKRDSMLLNIRTILRNINGNLGMTPVFIASDLFGTAIDKIVSKKTDVRTTGNFKLKGSGTALKKGLYESWDDFKRGIRTRQEELNRFDVTATSGKNFNEHHNGKLAKQLNAIAKTLNKIDNFTSFCLEVGDRPFFELWLNNSLNNQLRLNNVDIPTPEMLEIAKQEALQRTWQDDNMFAHSVGQLKKIFNKAHLPGLEYGFGDFAFDFVKTPTNIAKAIVEFSPAGFAFAGNNARKLKLAIDKGNFTPQLQKEFVRSMSNAITGTLIYTLVAIGASLGIVKLSGDEDDDKDASNYKKYIMGIPPYSIEFLGVNISYDWMQPFGSILAVVADFKESQKANPDMNEAYAIFEAIKAGGKVFAKQSFIQSLYDLCSSDDWVEGIGTLILAEPAKYIPQRWSQTASFFDEYRRTSYDYTDGFKSAMNKVIAKIPGLRTTLPKQVNILGEDIKNPQYLNIWEAFASPWNTYPKSSREVVGEIYALYKATGQNSVIPRTAPNYFTVKGNKITFTPEEKAEFQRNIGKRSAEMLGSLFDNKEYNNLSDDEKVSVIKDIYQFAYDKAKTEREYDYKTVSAMVGEYNGKPILTEEKYNDLTDSAKEYIVQEYFLSRTEVKYMDNYDRLINHYIKQAKE